MKRILTALALVLALAIPASAGWTGRQMNESLYKELVTLEKYVRENTDYQYNRPTLDGEKYDRYKLLRRLAERDQKIIAVINSRYYERLHARGIGNFSGQFSKKSALEMRKEAKERKEQKQWEIDSYRFWRDYKLGAPHYSWPNYWPSYWSGYWGYNYSHYYRNHRRGHRHRGYHGRRHHGRQHGGHHGR